MNAQALIKEVERKGGKLRLVSGKLTGATIPLEYVPLVRENKAEIIQLLNGQGQHSPCPAEEEIPVLLELKPCCLCGGVDFIHGHKGGFFCCECQPDARPGKRVKAGGRITARDGNDSNDGKIPKVSTDRKKREPLPANALEWLRKHRAELKAAGWKPAEIYRRNRSRGIAWLFLWGKRDVQVTMQHDGSIAFSFTDTLGRVIRQAARPKARSRSQDGR